MNISPTGSPPSSPRVSNLNKENSLPIVKKDVFSDPGSVQLEPQEVLAKMVLGVSNNKDEKKVDQQEARRLRLLNFRQTFDKAAGNLSSIDSSQISKYNYKTSSIQQDSWIPKNQKVDRLGLAENFIQDKLECDAMGFRHTWKRLDLLYVIMQYIQENTTALNKDGMSFPEIPQTNQFIATDYRVPTSFIVNQSDLSDQDQRCHCSAINKITIQNKAGELKKLEGTITIKNQLTTLIELLNICDIAPQKLNSIDWYVEIRSRLFIVKLQNEVLKGKSPFKAIEEYLDRHSEIIEELQAELREQTFKCAKNIDQFLKFKQNVGDILLPNLIETNSYLAGYQEAIRQYREKFHACFTKGETYRLFDIPKYNPKI